MLPLHHIRTEPPAGTDPASSRLQGGRSTIELQRHELVREGSNLQPPGPEPGVLPIAPPTIDDLTLEVEGSNLDELIQSQPCCRYTNLDRTTYPTTVLARVPQIKSLVHHLNACRAWLSDRESNPDPCSRGFSVLPLHHHRTYRMPESNRRHLLGRQRRYHYVNTA